VAVDAQAYTWDANGNLLADGVLTYTYDAANRLIAVTQGLTQSTLYTYNRLGDRVALARSYEPYGDVLTSAGSGVTSYDFTGEWRDGSGLIYLRARYYAPGVGRFMTGNAWAGNYASPQSLNRWAYVRNNPIKYADPTGHCILDLDCFIVDDWIISVGSTGRILACGPISAILHW
jgi:RHS repeat-associated protein